MNQLNLTMKTRIQIISIIKKTGAKFWKDVKVGDLYEIHYKVSHKTRWEKKYQPILEVYKDGQKIFEDSQGSFIKNASNFEIAESPY